jgi:integrase
MTEEERLQTHLVNTLGDELIAKIARENLQELLDAKAKKVARSVVDHLRFRLRSIFELALSEGIVERNPAVSLFTPRKCKPGVEKRVLTPEQAAQMLQALDLRERLIAKLATFEGMRPGEILALRFGDMDGESLWVRRRLYKGNIDSPKTRRSYRQVALSKTTTELLRSWREQSPLTGADNWIFPATTRDAPMRRDNIWPRHMLPKLKKVGLEWATFQVMRRTFATLSKQAGIDAHTRSAQMGNTVDVNENEYAVSSLEERLKAVRKLEATVAK